MCEQTVSLKNRGIYKTRWHLGGLIVALGTEKNVCMAVSAITGHRLVLVETGVSNIMSSVQRTMARGLCDICVGSW